MVTRNLEHEPIIYGLARRVTIDPQIIAKWAQPISEQNADEFTSEELVIFLRTGKVTRRPSGRMGK